MPSKATAKGGPWELMWAIFLYSYKATSQGHVVLILRIAAGSHYSFREVLRYSLVLEMVDGDGCARSIA